VARELAKYGLVLVEYVRLDVAKEAVNKQRIIHFSMER
jgi:hypothetical protein